MRTVRKQVHQPRSAAPLALLFAAGLCAACEASDITLQGRTTLVVSPLQARLPLGDTLRLRAIANGRPCDCLWTSVDASRATVDGAGLVRALTPGAVTVIATYRRDSNVKSSALVEVVAP